MEPLRLTNGTVELQVSLDCGRSVLAEADDVIHTPAGRWHARGGHRLWVAPESLAGSCAPDNDPVDCDVTGALTARIRQRTDAAGIEKQIEVAVAPAGTCVTITHRIANRTPWTIVVAPWAISIVTSDATAVIPQPVFRSHDTDLLPAQPLVQWSFTDLTDPRWTIGRTLLRLTPNPASPSPQKIGVGNRSGWCALIRSDVIFMKRFGWDPRAAYPDLGCNNELYTAADFLEVETLGPIDQLLPGGSAVHVEHWHLFPAHAPRLGEEGLTDALLCLVSRAAVIESDILQTVHAPAG
jgi:hypothetical protein